LFIFPVQFIISPSIPIYRLFTCPAKHRPTKKHTSKVKAAHAGGLHFALLKANYF